MKLAFFLFSISLTSILFSQSTKVTMNKIFTHFAALMKYSGQELKFTDPKFNDDILSNLKGLHESFEQADHNMFFKTSAFSPSLNVMKDHIKDTYESFKEGHKHFARIRANATLGICMSCHTQLPTGKASSFMHPLKSLKIEDFDNTLEYAEFLFLTRSYDQAQEQFKKAEEEEILKLNNLLKAYTEVQKRVGFNDSKLRRAVSRQLMIALKVENSVQKAKNILKRLENQNQLPKFLMADLKSWEDQLNKWKSPKKELQTKEDVMSFIRNYLKPATMTSDSINDGSFDMGLLISSGLLSRFLYRNPKSKLTPEILYWLALAENQLNNNYLYSLGEIYLKTCVTDYPKSAAARNCFQEYKEMMTIGFSGSGGTNIPEDIKNEISKLEKLIKN
ncbi:MAG: hypothetical protein H6622_14865 [Halobacteriovoraceae bacterium]|nr:hypothetical protein [Halobacteriovoraceae bacterium]